MAPPFPISGNIIIAGQRFKTNAPIITWEESKWDAHSPYCIPTATESGARGRCHSVKDGEMPYAGIQSLQRYSLRPALRRYGERPPLEAVKAVIRQFVVHHDGCASSDMCFNVLQNERGLSCHFLIDNDGTIYQTLDLALCGWHAAEWNSNSIGVELANFGDANAKPRMYESGKHGPQRETKAIKINGHKILAYDFTKEQYRTFGQLVLELQKLLPNLPVEYPQSSPGVQSWDTLPQSASFGFSGYISHYHLITQKWDPGPLDFKAFLSGLRGQFCLPIFWREPKDAHEQPVIPEQREDLTEATDKLHALNEQRAEGGFFPVGPWGESRLWHGGIHLTGKAGQPVYAPFPGRIVAARMVPDGAIGSTNFVLLRHELALGQAKMQFYSLYMHVANERKGDKPVSWTEKSELWKAGKQDGVVLLDDPIEAGAIIAHMGVAGPSEVSRAQVHVEFFSSGDLFADLPNTPWEVIDGTAGGRFCDVARINDLIDANKDGKLERNELKAFYENGGGGQTRNFVTFHVSEWTYEPNWSEALRVPADFKTVKKEDLDALVAEQITPGLWWDKRVAQWAKLPLDGVVYHYNPVSFVGWFNSQMLDAAATQPKDQLSKDDTSKVPSGVTDDKDGMAMRSSIDVTDDPCNKSLTLNELVLGYDQPDCAPP